MARRKQKTPIQHYNYRVTRAWNILARLFIKHGIKSYYPVDEVNDVEQSNKRNGRQLGKLEALEIAARKIKRRYEEEVG